MLGDSAYGTGELLDKINKAGWDATIKPWPLRPAVEGGFTLDDFAYDEQAGTVTCPNQITRRLSQTRIATFKSACRGLPAAEPVHHLRDRPFSQAHRVRTGQARPSQRATSPSSSRSTGPNARWSNAASPG